MTDVKTELSPDEWRELLEPYGWPEITVRSPAVLFRPPPGLLEYEVRMILKDSGGERGELDEWVQRSNLLAQAGRAVKAVQAAGLWLPDAPHIEFSGWYSYRLGSIDPAYVAKAELSFSACPAPRNRRSGS